MLSFAISQQKIDKKSVVRQPHDKQGTLSRRAFDFNAAAVTFRNFHGDGQPEAAQHRELYFLPLPKTDGTAFLSP